MDLSCLKIINKIDAFENLWIIDRVWLCYRANEDTWPIDLGDFGAQRWKCLNLSKSETELFINLKRKKYIIF